ncbi:MAG: Type IV secretory pathway VirB4 component-like protein [Candidatus Gottesmanbacteria bacterium GW2011_GWA2_44_17]|uniref:Type IV secretory pathway VirB4 component-like protein n=3 Tax=Candidatus Gottesmaniibacteriota TaxID=1752720 RepID=A0A0G1KH67_9BACT|nr:MAG: Type IV secretory pathway VirB4 component-like protein [Candidatus Gottesmanbacteria bacterium GW2011_GWB1_44_11c]KKT47209.1 MAG: Type IV secretory pathway VirB4 component-like protein [Candidatus Gottesmanbacteria bacterium GW2011_GWA2_44_17]
MAIALPNIIKTFVNLQPPNQVRGGKLSKAPLSITDLIAPPMIEVDFDNIKMGNYFFRTLFVAGYPRYVNANWLEPLISFNHTLDISMYIYPQRSEEILENMKRKIGEMEATIQSDIKRGHVVEPSVQVALEDALGLQQEIAKGAQRFFQFALYVTIPSPNLENLNKTTRQVEATLGSLMIVTKKAVLQMEEGFKTTMPVGQDRLMITRNMDTTSLATTFPFTTSVLTANEGILYGLNEGNGSLIIFDRFSLENANTVVFGKSGSGKSYMVKLEVIRSLMFGTEVIILDPENEYETLTRALGGEYIKFQFGAGTKINPFDLGLLRVEVGDEENELNQKILSLHGFLRVIMGKLSATEDATLDRALVLTYKQKGITPDPATQTKESPLMEDLYKTLIGMENQIAIGLADRLEKFVKGSLVGIFDQQTNVEITNPLTVFSIRDLEDELRPIAMYLILDYIWTKVRRSIKRRILIVDEGWYLMKHPDSAQFLYSIAKRSRKYYLGLTTITQDVEDFMDVDLGKAIIQNSSLQILLKQSSAAIDKVAKVFYLSEGEQHLLLSCETGQGLFFAGPAHAGIRVIASPEEHALVTTKPQELEAMREKAKLEKLEIASPPPRQTANTFVSQSQLKTPPMTTVVVEDLLKKEPAPPLTLQPGIEAPGAPAIKLPAAIPVEFSPVSGPAAGKPANEPTTRPLFTVEPIDNKTK